MPATANTVIHVSNLARNTPGCQGTGPNSHTNGCQIG